MRIHGMALLLLHLVEGYPTLIFRAAVKKVFSNDSSRITLVRPPRGLLCTFVRPHQAAHRYHINEILDYLDWPPLQPPDLGISGSLSAITPPADQGLLGNQPG